ncbi:hypothetical protein OS493_038396 [Desmophyllum pertusum]|uniref:Uncharacterized protein n=1 Tax=Desmophyllum pertusum TaxID=174260 RepID=A0A9W9YHW1_9CNID|nr:hypothetical protein OS493_038396 [Desmophyllum pertusum]
MKPYPVNVFCSCGPVGYGCVRDLLGLSDLQHRGAIAGELCKRTRNQTQYTLDDDQSGAREKRSVKQKLKSVASQIWKNDWKLWRKRINANNHSVMSPKQQSDWWFLAYVRGRDGRDGREGMSGPPGTSRKTGYPRNVRKNRVPQGHQENRGYTPGIGR